MGFDVVEYSKGRRYPEEITGFLSEIDDFSKNTLNKINERSGKYTADKTFADDDINSAENYAYNIGKMKTYFTDYGETIDEKYGDGYSAKAVESLSKYGDYLDEIKSYLEREKEYIGSFSDEEEFDLSQIKYDEISQNDDFEEKSQYKEKRKSAPGNAIQEYFRVYTGNYEDPYYEIVNKNENAKQEQRTSRVAAGAIGSTVRGMEYLTYLSDEQISIYNYLYETKGSEVAKKYVELFSDDLKTKWRESEDEAIKKLAEQYPAQTSVLTVLAAPLQGLSYLAQAADYIGNGKIDENAPYNDPVRFSQITRQTVSENFGKVGSFAYNTGMSMADFLMDMAVVGAAGGGLSAVNTAAGKAATLAIMGTSAAANETLSAKQRGLSDNQAFLRGTIAGGIEVVTELVSLESLLGADLLNDSVVKYILKNITAEASEEFAADILNLVAELSIEGNKGEFRSNIQKYINEGDSEKKAFWKAFGDFAKQLGLDTLAGAISGGILSGGVALFDISFNYSKFSEGVKQADNLNKNIRQNLDILQENEKVDFAKEMQNKLDSYEKAVKKKFETDSKKGNISFAERTAYDKILKSVSSAKEAVAPYVVNGNTNMRQLSSGTTNSYTETTPRGLLSTFAKEAGMGEKGAQNITEFYQDDMDAGDYAKAFATAYNAGENGLPVSALEGTIDQKLYGNIARAAYNSGKMDAMMKGAKKVNEVHLRNGGERADGKSAGKSVQRVAQGAEQKTPGRVGRAGESQNRGASPFNAGQKVTAKSLGIPGGTDENTVTVEAATTKEWKDIEARAEKEGLELVLFSGGNLSTEETKRARGMIVGNRVYIRTDAKNADATKIFDHEIAHRKVGNGSIVVSEVISDIKESVGEDNLASMREIYQSVYAGISDADIDEEIACDALAGINVFATKDEDLSEKMEEYLEGKAKSKAAEEAKPRAPPVDENGNPTETGNDARFSIEMYENIADGERSYRDSHTEYITSEELEKAQKQTAEMVGVMKPHADILPRDKVGKTIVKNGSYDVSVENTTICVRTLAYNEFIDIVSEKVGRPLTKMESFIVSQKLYTIAVEPQCLYCYVALDRKSFNEAILNYINQRDRAIANWENAGRPKISENSSLYNEYLAGRKPTPNMWKRYSEFIGIASKGGKLLSAEDVATESRRAYLATKNGTEGDQMRDILKYAQSASWAKKQTDYVAYKDDILKLGQNVVNNLNKHYGLRFYSFSDYSGAFIVENMQQIIDASIRGLKGLAYTKDVDFAKIVAPTGMNINISVFASRTENGFQIDPLQSADIEEAIALRKKYKNVGIVVVATEEEGVRWALRQEWSDVVIPFHIVRSGADIAEYYNWEIFNEDQNDKVKDESIWDSYVSSITTDEKKKKKISKMVYPSEHQNNLEKYIKICNERGLTPRFSQFLNEGENYMKLVNETRQSESETQRLKPVFDLDAAKKSFAKFVDKGGYYGGWYNDGVSIDSEAQIAADDIISGKKPNEVSYGLQYRIPDSFSRRNNRTHGRSYSVDDEDTAYLSAVERGDMETAQRMVDEAARMARYIPVSRYHQTGEKFTVFNNNNPVAGATDSETPNGLFFKENDHDIGVGGDFAKTGHGGDIQMRVYLSYENPLHFKNRDEARSWYIEHIPEYSALQKEFDQQISDFEKKSNELDKKWFDAIKTDDYAALEEIEKQEDDLLKDFEPKETEYRQKLRKILDSYFLNGDSGYDAIELDDDGHRYIDGKRENVHTYIVFDASQVKSADPVTYDDNGNVIPLSQRFNSENKDIRYSEDEEIPLEEFEMTFYDRMVDKSTMVNSKEEAAAQLIHDIALTADELRGMINKKYAAKRDIPVSSAILQNNEFKSLAKAASNILVSGRISPAKVRKNVSSLSEYFTEENEIYVDFIDSFYDEEHKDNAKMVIDTITNAFAAIEENIDQETGEASTQPLSLRELKATQQILRLVRKMYTGFDAIFEDGKRQSLTEKAKEYYDAVELAKKIVPQNDRTSFLDRFTGGIGDYFINASTPIVFARVMDGYDDGGFLTHYIGDRFIKDDANRSIIRHDLKKPVDDYLKEHKDFKKRLLSDRVTLGVHQILLTEAIDIYLQSTQENGKLTVLHLDGKRRVRNNGGFTYTNQNGVRTNDAIYFQSESDIKMFYNSLDAETKEFMKILQKQYATGGLDYKKPTDEKILGFSDVIEDGSYYQLKRDERFMQKNIGDARTAHSNISAVNNLSFNKARSKNAKAIPLMAQDSLSKFYKYCDDISLYAAFAEDIGNFNRLWNKNIGKESSSDSPTLQRTDSIKTLRLSYDSRWVRPQRNNKSAPAVVGRVERYVRKYLNDIQGVSTRTDKTFIDKFVGYGRSMLAQSSLGANIPVILTQFASYPTAATVIDPNYLAKGLDLKVRSNYEMMDKYSVQARIRAFDNSVVKSETLLTEINKVGEITTKPIGWVDRFTIGRLWVAAQYAAEAKGIGKFGTVENMEEAGKILDLAIITSQPTYMASIRSSFQRSDSEFVRLAMMFTSVVMKQTSMVTDSAFRLRAMKARMEYYKYIPSGTDAKTAEEIRAKHEKAKKEYEKAKKNFSKTYLTIAFTGILYSLMKSAINSIIRKSDKSFGEKVGETMLDSVIGLFPFVSNIVDLLKGFSGFEIPGLSALEDLISSVKSLGSDKYTVAYKIKNVANNAAALFGIPLSNVHKYIEGIIYNVADWTDNYKMQYEITNNTFKAGYTGNGKQFYDILFEAYENDKSDFDYIYRDMKARGYTDEQIASAVNSRLKKKYGAKTDKKFTP